MVFYLIKQRITMNTTELIFVQAEILHALKDIISLTDNQEKLAQRINHINQRLPVYSEAFEVVKKNANTVESVKSAILK